MRVRHPMTRRRASRVLIPHLTVRSGKGTAEIYKPFGPTSTSLTVLPLPSEDQPPVLMICNEFPEHGGDLGEGQCGVTIHRAVEDADTWSDLVLTAGARVTIQFLA
jgi:hypothetical protein